MNMDYLFLSQRGFGIYFLILFICCGCGKSSNESKAQKQEPPRQEFTHSPLGTPNEVFWLSEEERTKCIQQAEKGDAEAAFRLNNYYLFIKDDFKQAFKWLKVAAEHGHVTAQYNLGFEYLYVPSNLGIKNKEKALFWFNKAALQGHKAAKERLEEHDRREW